MEQVMTEIGLIHTSDDGRKKFWRAIVDLTTGDLWLEFGVQSQSMRQVLVKKEKFTKANAELELEARAAHKIAHGYAIGPKTKGDSSPPSEIAGTERAPQPMTEMLSVTESAVSDDWFF